MDLNTLNTYFTAQMHVATAGTYRFAFGNQGNLTNVQGADALGSLFLDIDRNGKFENATGENLMELIAGNGATQTGIPLAPGDYNIGIPETNGSGGSFLGVVFSADDGATWQIVDPSDPAQAGMWNIVTTPANNVVKTGTGVVTLLANNIYNGTTTINGGTLVPNVPAALGTTKGIIVNSGGSLGLPGAFNLTVPVSIAGPGAAAPAPSTTLAARTPSPGH